MKTLLLILFISTPKPLHEVRVWNVCKTDTKGIYKAQSLEGCNYYDREMINELNK
jgi:hypothetical protein